LRKLALVLLVVVLTSSGCIRKLALNGLADSLAASGEVFASDEDPELIRDATPFALKTMESLLAEVPRNRGLLLATCRGFTQYAYAFVQVDADLREPVDYLGAEALRERALGLYLRARDYGLRGLELEHPGISRALRMDPRTAADQVGREELELLYWAGAAWGLAISLGRDRPGLAADTDAVRAMMDRALVLDETFDGGSIHEALITLESLPAAMGGSAERARQHFERALELSGGTRAGTYVTMAEGVSLAAQDRPEFEALLGKALDVDLDADPGARLANAIFQRKARALLERADELFLD
jgi:hypothetical protein